MNGPKLGILLTTHDTVCVANAYIFLPAVFNCVLDKSGRALEIDRGNSNTKDIRPLQGTLYITDRRLVSVCRWISHDLRFCQL